MEQLDTEVRALLDAKRGHWAEVVTKAEVSYSWISKFVRGEITNPRYATLVRIKALLSPPAGKPARRATDKQPAQA